MSFEHAPVSKALIILSGLNSFVVGLFDLKHYFHLQFTPHISRHHQYWRLLTRHLAFGNSSDLLIAEIIFFNVGVQIERLFGSVRFASFIVVSLLVSTLLEFTAVLLFHRIGLNYFSAGPTALVYCLLYQYSRIVPFSYQFRIFGLPLNNKSFMYLLALQLAISHPPGSPAIALIGILTGQIYRSDLANLKAYRIPPSVVRFAKTYILPLIGSTRPPRRSNQALPDDARPGSAQGALRDDGGEPITTARPARGDVAGMDPDGPDAGASNASGSSVVREWVNELTGRGVAGSGLRAPPESEIVQVTAIFPNLRRDVIVGTLQRSPNIERAIETLLSAHG